MNLKRIFKSALVVGMLAIALTGCKTPEKVAYFQDVADMQVFQQPSVQSIKVEPHDKISIVVTSKDPALAQMFNLSAVTSRLGQNQSYNGTGTPNRNYSIPSTEGLSTYTVSPKGTIDFPVLGTLQVAGMTRDELAGYIKGEIMGRDLIKDPVVTVEFLNTGISVMGEVKSPGRYDMNTDQITLLEGLALAGDLNLQGQRENILVIRKNGDKTETYRVDITDSNAMMSSPAYYLKQGDVIYVEPNDTRKRQTTVNGNNMISTGFWVSVASLLTSVLLLFVK